MNPSDKQKQHDFEKLLFDFYRDTYKSEEDQRDKMLGRAGLNVAAITVIGNILMGYANYIPLNMCEWNAAEVWLFVFSFLAFALGICALILTLLAVGFGANRYRFLAVPKEYENYFEKLDEYNKAATAQEKVNLEEDFRKVVGKAFIECATSNNNNNRKRMRWSVLALRFSGAAILLLLLGLPLVFVLKASKKSPVYSVQIINPTSNPADEISTSKPAATKH